MRTTRMLSLALMVTFLLPACSDDKADEEPGFVWTGDPRFTELAKAVDADLKASTATGASVAVWLDGQVTWVGGFGTANPEGGPPPGENTQFMIGSDTKKIAAISLLRKVESGEVTLDTTVADVLPDLAMARAPGFVEATVHQLISHQGGIMDGVEGTDDTTDAGLREYAYGTFASEYYPLAPPGRIWNYSNPNFSIAGLIDEELDSRAWADIVSQDIFAPLGMTRTVARKSEVDEDRALGVGYANMSDRSPGPVSFESTWESAFVRPAGLVWSTPSDMMRLAAFLVDGNDAILGSDLLAQVHAPQVPMYPDLPGSYGYGLMVNDGMTLEDGQYDVAVWSHGGNTWTHTSTFYILPEQRFAISILSNGYGNDFTNSVVAAAKSLVTLPAPTTAEEPVFDAAALDNLTGTYVDEFNAGDVIVTRSGDALSIEVPSLDTLGVPYEHEMEPLSTLVWIATVDGTPMDFAFIEGPDGEMYARNRGIVAIRWSEGTGWPMLRPPPVPSRERVLAALAAARLDVVPRLLRPQPRHH